jgi:hypothetical protein
MCLFEERVNETKEMPSQIDIYRVDADELKRQLSETERKKNEFEALCQHNGRLLREIEHQLQEEQNEKRRLESTTNQLRVELERTKTEYRRLENEKEQLNQHCIEINEQQRLMSNESLVLTKADTMPIVSTVSDVDYNRMSSNDNLRYRRDLEKALQDKQYYQDEYDRLKFEKEQIIQEKLEHKIKYDCLLNEIRVLLVDRSKLEQQLTSDLHERIEQRQQAKNDLYKYQMETAQLSMKLADAEVRLKHFQSENSLVITSNMSNVNNDVQVRTTRLDTMSNDLNREHSPYESTSH